MNPYGGYIVTNVADTYTEFFRIDLDARGGYARVADVLAHQSDGTFVHRAFKLMRHELVDPRIGFKRFESELRILSDITKDKNAPVEITRIYDSGFAQVGLSNVLHELGEGEKASPSFEIFSTGIEIQSFLDKKRELDDKEPGQWVPYLVVELAPYTDSLLRQIKPQSEKDQSNLYRLPVDHIAQMALFILDVLEYLHVNLKLAYIDWKPEHIYWNGAKKQLKLIDWNVNSSLADDRTTKQLIREDLRMFCGAALYCSLALTDPEDPDRSIGPIPDLPKNLMPAIRPRYWTDKPNFYQREKILDDNIKLLVQVGLNPRDGFDTAKDFKRALLRYVGQSDSYSSLPKDAVQHYKRARSYIGANDLSLAIMSLEMAVESASAAGRLFSDAEDLLRTLRDQLSADDLKKKAKFALELRQWNYVFELYSKAISLDPNNETMKTELKGLQDLLNSESELRKKGKWWFFTDSVTLKRILETTKDLVDADNPIYGFVKKQYERIRLSQVVGFISLMIVLIALLGSILKNTAQPPALVTNTFTPSQTSTFTYTPEATVTPLISTATATVSAIGATPSSTVPAITATVVQGYGILTVSFFYPVETPNGKRIEPALQGEQFLTIIGSQIDRGELWYQCMWEANGVRGEGWILGRFIQFSPAPTSTP